MRCLKSFCEHIAAGGPERQTAENHIRTAPLIRLSAFGNADIVRVACMILIGKEPLRLRPELPTPCTAPSTESMHEGESTAI